MIIIKKKNNGTKYKKRKHLIKIKHNNNKQTIELYYDFVWDATDADAGNDDVVIHRNSFKLCQSASYKTPPHKHTINVIIKNVCLTIQKKNTISKCNYWKL